MILKLKNIAKIKEAEIKCDGITIIAGENNTGKSTVGKVLFALFNSTYGFEKKINDIRIEKIINALENEIMLNLDVETLNKDAFLKIRRYKFNVRKTISFMESEKIKSYIKNSLEGLFNELGRETDAEMFAKMLSEKIEVIADTPNIELLKVAISRYFNRVFCNQINNLYSKEEKASAELIIKEKNMEILFEGNDCKSFESGYSIMHEATYIDNPFILDMLESNFHNDSITERDLINKLGIENDVMDNLFEEVWAGDKLKDIYMLLNSTIGGDIISNVDGSYSFVQSGSQERLAINNLSTGLKSFAIIQMLLKKGAIKDKDVLILDEPEIHLHPQWQLLYAEVVVLLEKYFDLTIVITTHSPYFLKAIDVFSVKHGVRGKCNYYLSDCDERFATIKEVKSLEPIFKKLAEPLQDLKDIEFEVGVGKNV